jgi:hypothetical protein
MNIPNQNHITILLRLGQCPADPTSTTPVTTVYIERSMFTVFLTPQVYTYLVLNNIQFGVLKK